MICNTRIKKDVKTLLRQSSLPRCQLHHSACARCSRHGQNGDGRWKVERYFWQFLPGRHVFHQFPQWKTMAERRRIIPSSVGPLFPLKKEKETVPTLRFSLTLKEPSDKTCSVFSYCQLVKKAAVSKPMVPNSNSKWCILIEQHLFYVLTKFSHFSPYFRAFSSPFST